MRHADLVGFFFRVLPFDSWKDALLRGHIENCAACRARMASREEARRVLVQGEDAGDPGKLWPEIADRIGACDMAASTAVKARAAEPVPAPRRWAWRWAAAVFGTALAVILTFALVRFLRAPAPGVSETAGAAESEPDQVRIHYVRIDNEPAQTFIFKPHDSDVVIVWAGKNI